MRRLSVVLHLKRINGRTQVWPKTPDLCRIDGKELLLVMKTYFDGSWGNDDNGDNWITLAGIAGTDEVWASFDQKWKAMLANRYPVAPYIHMIELLGNDDPFESEAGWDFDKKQSLIQDAIVLLSQVNKEEFRMARCSINESARHRLSLEGIAVVPDPLKECAGGCLTLTAGVYSENVPETHKEPLYVFYDRGERFLSKFKQGWLEKRTRPGKTKNPNNWWDQFADVQDLELPFHAPLQVADMIAWSHTRKLSERERPFSYLKEWLLKVIPSSTIDIDEKFMRANAHIL